MKCIIIKFYLPLREFQVILILTFNKSVYLKKILYYIYSFIENILIAYFNNFFDLEFSESLL